MKGPTPLRPERHLCLSSQAPDEITVERPRFGRLVGHAPARGLPGRLRRTAAIVWAGTLAVLAPSHAGAYPHLVRGGETLASLAARIYGDPKLETVLVGANALDAQGGSAIAVGMWLEIPAPFYLVIQPGDTWPKLAATWLGDERRSDVIARANHTVPWVNPHEGREVVVPAVVAHIAAEDESTPSLARRYWGDATRGWELDAYNFKKPGKLHRGEIVLVPLVDLSLSELGKAEAARAAERWHKESLGQLRARQDVSVEQITGLEGHVRAGHFVEAIALGNRLIGAGDLTKPMLARIHRALLEAYAALDAERPAREACASWRAVSVDAALDPKLTSPKVLRLCP